MLDEHWKLVPMKFDHSRPQSDSTRLTASHLRIVRKRVTKPSFYRANPITDCLTVVQCRVATLTLNRQINVGFSVLELSKEYMYDFHYNHMCVKYPRANQLRLLFTDTDSLAYAVQATDDKASRYDFSE